MVCTYKYIYIYVYFTISYYVWYKIHHIPTYRPTTTAVLVYYIIHTHTYTYTYMCVCESVYNNNIIYEKCYVITSTSARRDGIGVTGIDKRGGKTPIPNPYREYNETTYLRRI